MICESERIVKRGKFINRNKNACERRQQRGIVELDSAIISESDCLFHYYSTFIYFANST